MKITQIELILTHSPRKTAPSQVKLFLIFYFRSAEFIVWRCQNLCASIQKVTFNKIIHGFNLGAYISLGENAAILLFFILLSSIYIRRKYCICENFQHPVFDACTCLEMSWTRFDHF